MHWTWIDSIINHNSFDLELRANDLPVYDVKKGVAYKLRDIYNLGNAGRKIIEIEGQLHATANQQ